MSTSSAHEFCKGRVQNSDYPILTEILCSIDPYKYCIRKLKMSLLNH